LGWGLVKEGGFLHAENLRIVVYGVFFRVENLGLVEGEPLWRPAVFEPFLGAGDGDTIAALVAGDGHVAAVVHDCDEELAWAEVNLGGLGFRFLVSSLVKYLRGLAACLVNRNLGGLGFVFLSNVVIDLRGLVGRSLVKTSEVLGLNSL
jgi:hypothetical protein